MVILDSEPNRFTPFLNMHKHIEAIKAQDERYCKYSFPQGRELYLQESMQESYTTSNDFILQEHYSPLTREGTDLYTAWHGQKNTPDKPMPLTPFEI